ncbi:hypothetical protein CAEBREN_11867 [Caenorhabditis brenneri]|uniref:Uncharacterized protein n=1 Tax=Caenorhabditis brenneri TaxID=135651 RepID=G0MVU0_CAEBE|nr:hypothetical protein CAEBREN_11867 [Caenorhabditis brenneri]
MSTSLNSVNGSVNLGPNELEKIADTVFSRFIKISKAEERMILESNYQILQCNLPIAQDIL